MYRYFSSKTATEGNYPRNVYVGGNVLLKRVLKNCGVRMRSGYVWLRIC
jgi:hypothetical protein